jgi:hypothetical protein
MGKKFCPPPPPVFSYLEIGSGSRIRPYDLRVMSLMAYVLRRAAR